MTEILLTVAVASALGSLHCIGMCGGFVAFYSGSSAQGARVEEAPVLPHLAYNGGRLLSYTGLGAAAGALGATLNLAGSLSGVREVAALVAGVLILAWGGVLLAQAAGATRSTLPAPRWLSRLLGRVVPGLTQKPPVVRAMVLGVASTLLPCGWLYGFAATAAGTGSAAAGALVMAVFWLGTLPAMLFAGVGIRFAARVLGPRLGVVMPVMLIVMGLFTLLQRGLPSPEPASSDTPAQVSDASSALGGEARTSLWSAR